MDWELSPTIPLTNDDSGRCTVSRGSVATLDSRTASQLSFEETWSQMIEQCEDDWWNRSCDSGHSDAEVEDLGPRLAGHPYITFSTSEYSLASDAIPALAPTTAQLPVGFAAPDVIPSFSNKEEEDGNSPQESHGRDGHLLQDVAGKEVKGLLEAGHANNKKPLETNNETVKESDETGDQTAKGFAEAVKTAKEQAEANKTARSVVENDNETANESVVASSEMGGGLPMARSEIANGLVGASSDEANGQVVAGLDLANRLTVASSDMANGEVLAINDMAIRPDY
jgi:hypothetical protein